HIIILQLTIVYTCAGLAKLNYDWLFRAMPLAIWLPERQGIPVLGYFFQQEWFAYFFSWAGAIYDLSIAYFLMFKKTRPFAYFFVVVFHLMTWLLFNIGLFPFIMIFNTLIFFSAGFHQKLLSFIGYKSQPAAGTDEATQQYAYKTVARNIMQPLLLLFVVIQLALPFRYLLYPSQLLWAEEGYRFSWRVMLVEKTGQTTFTVKDSATSKRSEIINGQYLTAFQEKQMNIQPDFILQFAHFLKREYEQKHGFINPIVTVDAHVALNGRSSQRFVDPEVNLAALEDGLGTKSWILPFKQ
ncbi:MAG: HTTM domain-containing protein, partial [Bacteroidota bacterium]